MFLPVSRLSLKLLGIQGWSGNVPGERSPVMVSSDLEMSELYRVRAIEEHKHEPRERSVLQQQAAEVR